MTPLSVATFMAVTVCVAAQGTLRLQGTKAGIEFGASATLTATCAGATPKVVSITFGNENDATVEFLNVPPSCAGSEVSQPCASGTQGAGLPRRDPHFYCVWRRPDEEPSIVTGPVHAHANLLHVDSTVAVGFIVHATCSLPSMQAVRDLSGDDSGQHFATNISLSVMHYAHTESAPAFPSDATLLPYAGIVGGDVKQLELFAPPPPPPPSPPPTVTCYSKYLAGDRASGMKNLNVNGVEFRAWCDQSSHGGGWTLALQLGADGNGIYRNSPTCTSIKSTWTVNDAGWEVDGTPNSHTPPAGTAKALSCELINQIRKVSDDLGLAADQPGYWTKTPSDGKQIFGRHDCPFELNRDDGNLAGSHCRYWNIDASQAWSDGAYWHANSPSYYWFMGQGRGTVTGATGCAHDGSGLSWHKGGTNGPFHRGWCGTSEWGLVYVR